MMMMNTRRLRVYKSLDATTISLNEDERGWRLGHGFDGIDMAGKRFSCNSGASVMHAWPPDNPE